MSSTPESEMAEATSDDWNSFIDEKLKEVNVNGRYEPIKHFAINERIGTGTFHVYRACYTDENTHQTQDIIAKEIPCKFPDSTLQFSKDRLNYAVNEANLNYRCRQYGWMPICHYMGWSYDDSSETFWLFFYDENGRPFTQELIDNIATKELRINWTKTLMFALCCSHVTGVFHRDVSDFATSGTINAILIDNNELKLIDFGDSIEAKTDEEAQDGLLEDIKGFLNFVLDHLYKDLTLREDISDQKLIECVKELRKIKDELTKLKEINSVLDHLFKDLTLREDISDQKLIECVEELRKIKDELTKLKEINSVLYKDLTLREDISNQKLIECVEELRKIKDELTKLKEINSVLDHHYKDLNLKQEIDDQKLRKCVEELRRIKEELRRIKEAGTGNYYTKEECKALFCKKLKSLDYPFPTGFAAVLIAEDLLHFC